MPDTRTPVAAIVTTAVVAVVLLVLTAFAALRPTGSEPWTMGEQVTEQRPTTSVSEVAGAPRPTVPQVADGAVPASGTGATAAVSTRADAEWATAVAGATGIPPVAAQAYGDAVLALAAEDPGCGLGWTTLAAIGAIESGHGTHGGSVLGPTGRADPPILGPALDGAGVAAIRASPASTAMHADPVWEHAVGPLQFLPSTWARWAVDADADGAADPQDLDDAALAAGRYLCAGDRDLGQPEGWRGAVLSYNRSEAYVADVLAVAVEYARVATAVHGR